MDTLEKKEKQHYSINNTSLIYLNTDIGSVFDSQVAHLLITLSKVSAFSGIVLLCGIKNNTEKNRVVNALKESEIKIAFFKCYPNYPFFNRQQENAILKALIEVGAQENCHIHIRGELLASLALKPILRILKKLDRVVVDIRGAAYEELTIYSSVPFWKKFLKKISYQIALKRLRNYHKISVVSSALKKYIHTNVQIPNENIHIIQCLAGDKFVFNRQSREDVRKYLGINYTDKLLVFSSGGNAGWQNTSELKSLLSDKWTILNLSKEFIQEPGIINKFIPYAEVPDYLNAADVAIIFREANIINEVACPVKFCEYSCCGLPIISNNSVNEIVRYIENGGAGKVLLHTIDIHAIDINSLIKLDREEISKNARNIYGNEAIANQYLNLYSI